MKRKGEIKTQVIPSVKKKRQLRLRGSDFSTIFHALDIMASDYSYNEKVEKRVQKEIDKVEGRLFKLKEQWRIK